MGSLLQFDSKLIRRYDTAGPRYTSYPTVKQFHERFDETAYREHAARTNTDCPPLSLYVHLPFCATVCYYCACNKIVTKDRSRSAPYVERLVHELALQGVLFDRARRIEQLHWGGGTPTFLSHDEMRALMDATRARFTLRDDDQGEYSIEVDPRRVDQDTVALLRELGFNRMSIGVQDFDPAVQSAVNRIQSEAQTLVVLESARVHGFRSINMDLIYGLPHQTAATFARTLDQVIAMRPDRLAVYNYAHLPDLFKPQRRIDAQDLPPPAEKLNILQTAINRLNHAGYAYIGMDHFALPDDELAEASLRGTLQRNFQGYSTRAGCDLVGIGTTAIGKIGNAYSQNMHAVEDYYMTLDAGKIPIRRGFVLGQDDLLRRDVIMELLCRFAVDIGAIERKHQIEFWHYFAPELTKLEAMRADGLIEFDQNAIQVQPAGKLLIRNIGMVFDRYLREELVQRYSKVI